MDKKKRLVALFLVIVAVALLLLIPESSHNKEQYFTNSGKVFGTYYSIQYESDSDQLVNIEKTLSDFDASLSMFNPSSTISAVNNNRDTITDAYFEQMWQEAMSVSDLSHGAFDITVAPLVNLWGFGFKNRDKVTQTRIDSVLPFVGYHKVLLQDHHVVKQDPHIMLDASAVAKGQACDLVAQMLRAHGCKNYLVDIGGEVVAHGVNKSGDKWRIGINKPIDDPTGQNSEIESVVESDSICMATSGNYRNFYYEGSQRRSHTIDPRSGYPVQHTLLSATVVASSCMRADALATACMVVGADSAIEMINSCSDACCLLIVGEGDSTRTITSTSWRF